MDARRLFVSCCAAMCALFAVLLGFGPWTVDAARTAPTHTQSSVLSPQSSITPTPGCCQNGVAGNMTGSCQGDGHYFTYGITNTCNFTVTANGGISFEVSPNPTGPWTSPIHGDYFGTPFGPGYTERSGALWSGPLPVGNNWWRYRLYLSDTRACWTVDVASTPQSACAGGTPTPTLTPVTTSTPTATPTLCPTGGRYTIVEATGTVVPGVLDIGNHCDDCATNLVLPFPVRVYERTFTSVMVHSNGWLQFESLEFTWTPGCQAIPGVTYGVFPYRDDLRTDTPGSGIYTRVTGSAPNRELYIEWRATPFGSNERVNFHIHFSEQPLSGAFDVVYGTVPSNASLSVGVQRNWTNYTWHWCDGGGPSEGVRLLFMHETCVTATPAPPTHTPTATVTVPPSATASPEPSATAPPGGTVTASATATATATPPASCGLVWRSIPNTLGGTLYGVEAIASDDVWAVGASGAMHWDGDGWTVVPSPPGLRDVSAVSSADVWAVGGEGVIHWDGSGWTTSYVAGNGEILNGVAAISSDDVWVVGAVTVLNCSLPCAFTLHWNGVEWSRVAIPGSLGRASFLYAVTALSSSQIWAVGTYMSATSHPLILRWDGNQWNNQSTGEPIHSWLYEVAALSPDHIWAVGAYATSPNSSLVMRYDGSAWNPLDSPQIGSVNGVKAVTTSDAWAVGNGGILHWDGAAWNLDQATDIALNAVDGVSPTDVWAVGEGVMHYSPALFADVPPNHTFYPYIQCLGCRGLISGYADGTFRPGNNVTRGQTSKVVSNAAGINEPVSGQTFEDVTPSNTFYVWIERLARRGIMFGYPCGGPNEPCGPGNRPYFRWQLDATRGQLSKIVSEAAGIAEPIPVGQQTFTDVPNNNPFWVFIERLAARGIIMGYPCGGAGEPCDPQNRPYFRWQNNATRGQTSKMVANMFFPGCEMP